MESQGKGFEKLTVSGKYRQKKKKRQKKKRRKRGREEGKHGIILLCYRPYHTSTLPGALGHRETRGELEQVVLVCFSTLPQHPVYTGQLPGKIEMPRASPPPPGAHSPEASAMPKDRRPHSTVGGTFLGLTTLNLSLFVWKLGTVPPKSMARFRQHDTCVGPSHLCSHNRSAH